MRSTLLILVIHLLVGSISFKYQVKPLQNSLFLPRHRYFTALSCSNDEEGKHGVPAIDLDKEDPQYAKKLAALELLDVLTCTDDEDDPEYDVGKDIRRDKLLLNNDYHTLKLELRKRGLRTGGDKEEMIARLLLHVIDPSINYMDATGREPTLSYVDESDIQSGKVSLVPEEKRNKQGYDFNSRTEIKDDEDENASVFTREVANDLGRIDAEDVQVLRPRKIRSSVNNEVGGGNDKNPTSQSSKNRRDQVMMDGLTRQEVVFKPMHISRDAAQVRIEDGKEEGKASVNSMNSIQKLSPFIRGYLVGGRDVLRTWERNPSVVVLLPDVLTVEGDITCKKDTGDPDLANRERFNGGWRSRGMRVLADEIAFNMQCIVIVPDLARGLETVEISSSSIKVSHAGNGAQSKYRGAPLEGTRDYATRKRLFDDITSTISFARNEYGSESISLAGVRSGAGLALEASCDLYNMACLSQIYSLDDIRDIHIEEGGGIGTKDENWNMCAGLWELQSRMAPQPPQSFKYYRALENAERHGDSSFSYMDEYFTAEEGSLYDSDGILTDADWFQDPEDGEEDINEEQLLLMAEGVIGSMAQDQLLETEPEVEEGHPSAYFESDDVKKISDLKGDETRISEAELHAALEKASRGENAQKGNVEDDSERLQEKRRFLDLMEKERAQIGALLRKADEKAATNALTRGTLCSSSPLSLHTIPSLLPRALFLVDPMLYDQERVQQELRLPSFFVYGCGDDALTSTCPKDTASESVPGSDRADLLFSLKKRHHEVVDFCIRQYEGVSGKFLLEPTSPEDAVCGQEAVVIGSTWLDIYGRKLAPTKVTNRDEYELENDGNDGDRDGDNKGLSDPGYSGNSQILAQTKFDSPFVRISAKELGGTARVIDQMKQAEDEARASGMTDKVAKAFKRPSPVATFLHDDSQLYREQPSDGWEFQQAV